MWMGATWLVTYGCGTSSSSDAAENAPCTRSRDCTADLVCRDGVCVGPLGPSDAGADADATAFLDGD